MTNVSHSTSNERGALLTPPAPPPPRRAARLMAYLLAACAPLIVTALYQSATRDAGVATGFPLDDSWIHAQYARTMVEGRPFEYVPGERSIGTTSVLFDVIWAIPTAITGEYVITVHVLNTLLTMLAGALIAALLLRFRVSPLAAGLGGALIVCGYPFAWSNLSGMETALATALTLAAVLAHITWGRTRGWRGCVAPPLMALAAMARPENLILYPLSELDNILLFWRGRSPGSAGAVTVGAGTGKAMARLAGRLAAFGITLAPYIALNLAVHGAPVPNTFAAKVGNLSFAADVERGGVEAVKVHVGAAFDVLWSGIEFAWSDNAALIALVPVGLLLLIARREYRGPAADSLFPLLIFLGGCTASGLVTLGAYFPGQSQRYLIQWLPMLMVYGVVGAHLLAMGVRTLLPERAAAPAYAAVLLALAAGDVVLLARLYPDQVYEYVTSVKNINEMQVALGHWIKENTPEDAVIATNDIGAIAFFGDRPIVDTIGLIDPQIVKIRRMDKPTQPMLDYLQEKGVTHALLFPGWHPDLILDSHLHPIERIVLEDNYICGDDRMLVLEADWGPIMPRDSEPPWLLDELAACRELLKIKQFMP